MLDLSRPLHLLLVVDCTSLPHYLESPDELKIKHGSSCISLRCRDGAVRCQDCTLDCCGFVGIAAAQGGRAEVVRCTVKRSGNFGLLATDPGSSIYIHDR